MKFWDASAIVPLLVAEANTQTLQALLAQDSEILAWWATKIECASALARLERERMLEANGLQLAAERLNQVAGVWNEVEPSELVRDNALRFLRVHTLRAADALQLGAAFVASESRPPSLEFVTLDDRLAEAARKEGFVLVAV